MIEGIRVTLLSHSLSPNTPAYGGGDGLKTARLTSIAAGDTANTMQWCLPNHLGTHVDAPLHFFTHGDDLEAFAPDFWFFRVPQIVDAPSDDGHLVQPEDLSHPVAHDTDLLLVRTGHERVRGDERYWAAGPGLSPQLADYLRTERPAVRAVGVDLISITCRLRRSEGREAHRAFLDPERPGRPLVLIEDMALGGASSLFQGALVSPLFVAGADGGPVTVWAFSEEGERS